MKNEKLLSILFLCVKKKDLPKEFILKNEKLKYGPRSGLSWIVATHHRWLLST